MFEGDFIAKGNTSDQVYIRNIAFILAKEGGQQPYSYNGLACEMRLREQLILTMSDMAGGFHHSLWMYSGSSNAMVGHMDFGMATPI